jgi:hypothetical protein
MLDNTFADRFAAEWIGAWNSHDLDRNSVPLYREF